MTLAVDFVRFFAEGGLLIQREMSKTPLLDMTVTDLKRLSTAIQNDFTNIGFTCPKSARTTLAFGKSCLNLGIYLGVYLKC